MAWLWTSNEPMVAKFADWYMCQSASNVNWMQMTSAFATQIQNNSFWQIGTKVFIQYQYCLHYKTHVLCYNYIDQPQGVAVKSCSNGSFQYSSFNLYIARWVLYISAQLLLKFYWLLNTMLCIAQLRTLLWNYARFSKPCIVLSRKCYF